ncbi:MAG: hypothetical protein ACK5NF_02655 [Bacilli bacterium]
MHFTFSRYVVKTKGNHDEINEEIYKELKEARKIPKGYIFLFSLYKNDIIEVDGKICRYNSNGKRSPNAINCNEIYRNKFWEPSFNIGEDFKTIVTTRLITSIIQENVNVIICNERYEPTANILPIHGNFRINKIIKEQIKWDEVLKRNHRSNLIKLLSENILLTGNEVQLSYVIKKYIGAIILFMENGEVTDELFPKIIELKDSYEV